ncbi:unnamed protein product [Ixodes pacificus]
MMESETIDEDINSLIGSLEKMSYETMVSSSIRTATNAIPPHPKTGMASLPHFCMNKGPLDCPFGNTKIISSLAFFFVFVLRPQKTRFHLMLTATQHVEHEAER